MTDETINVGFKIYKSYNFGSNYDLDGNPDTPNEAFEFEYTGGALVTTEVKIVNEKPNKIEITDGVLHNVKVGSYLELISTPEIQTKQILVEVDERAKNTNYGLAYAQWKNGKYSCFCGQVFAKNLYL